MNNEYYVYVCFVDGDVKYIGMGKGDRYKHCTSGTSSCAELNRDFFTGKELRVEIIHHSLTKNEAAYKEAEVIAQYDFTQLYNKQRGKQKDLNGLDKLIRIFVEYTSRYEKLTLQQVRKYLDRALLESNYCVKLYGYDNADGWWGLPHKVAKLFGLNPEFDGSKYRYRNDQLTFEDIQSNFRQIIK